MAPALLELCILVSLLFTGCASMTQHDSSSRIDKLAARLAACKVADMATGLAADPQVAAVWGDYPDASLYTAIVGDAHRAEPVRFAAALVLRSRGAETFQRVEPRVMAEVFAGALQHDLAGAAQPWGRLWAGGDALGVLGAAVIELGRPALRPLTALLDDATPRDGYFGSEEATEMAMRRYRVKDFAAFYLARIAHVDLPWENDLARRDAAIARLRGQLAGAK